MSSIHRFRLTHTAGAICLLAQVCAQAQMATPPAAPASAARSDGVHNLSTVVISGPRATGFTSAVVGIGAFRDQAPVDVPLTNSVVTREVLDAQGAKSVLDAIRNTAGVTRSQLGSSYNDNLAVRGVTMENRSSYRLNGSLPLISLIPIPIENKERVEVLKGASSMYYGMVPPAGIVSFETKRAGPKPVTSFSTSVNQYGGYDAAIDIGRRFGDEDRFGLRINALDGKEDPGLKPYSGRRTLQSAAFDFRVLDNLTVRADLEHYTKIAPEQATITTIGTAKVLPAVPDNRTNLGGEWAKTAGKSTNGLLRVDWGVSENWNVTAEYGQVKATRDRQATTFNFTVPTGDSPTNPASYTTGSGRVSGNFNSGAYYINKNTRLDLSGRIETGPIAHEATVGWTRNTRIQDIRGNNIQSFGPLPQNLYSPIDVPEQVQLRPNSALTTQLTDTGIYAVDRIIFSPRWHLMLGLRRTDYQSLQTDPLLASSRIQTTKTSPNISGIFKPAPNMSIYASRLKGLEAGASVGNTFSNSGELLPPAVTTQNELGWKMQLAGGTLLQAAYFDIRKAQSTQADAPIGAPRPPGVIPANQCDPAQALGPTCTQHWQVQSQNGEARFKGVELAASGELTRNIGLVASAIFMDPKITKDLTPGASNQQGKIPGNTAKRTASLFGEYRFDALPGLSVNAGVYYVGSRPVANTNNVFLPGVATYSLGARYRTQIMATAAIFQINVDNATDKNYWSAADSTTANPLISYGLPRLIRATAKFDF